MDCSRPMPACPNCSGYRSVKNGRIHNAKQRFCRECGRQFVEHRDKRVIDQKTRLVDRLLLERRSQAGIARAVQICEQWLHTYVNDKSARVPRQVELSAKTRGN